MRPSSDARVPAFRASVPALRRRMSKANRSTTGQSMNEETSTSCLPSRRVSCKNPKMRLGLTSRHRPIVRSVIAGAILTLWFVTIAAVASPQLHHWLHKDSNSPKHECPITHLGKGSLLAGTVCATPAAPPPVVVFFSCRALQHSSVFDYAVSRGRAPPSVSSSITVVG